MIEIFSIIMLISVILLGSNPNMSIDYSLILYFIWLIVCTCIE